MRPHAKLPGGVNESTYAKLPGGGAMRAQYQEGGAMIAHAKLPGGKGGNESTCQITRRGAMREYMPNYQEGAMRALAKLPGGGQ